MIRQFPKEQSFLPGALRLCLGLLTYFAVLVYATSPPSYVPTDNIQYLCGPPPSGSPSSDYYKGTALNLPRKIVRSHSGDSDFAAAAPRANPCIYRTKFTHPIPVTPGPKFVRLHFYPVSYGGRSISDAIFSVSIEQYTLLRTTPASYSLGRSSGTFVCREYIVYVDGDVLNLTFTPSNMSADTYAFVNMIEVVSMPYGLYIAEQAQLPPPVGNSSRADDRRLAFETAYRMNVGGPYLSREDDTGLLRQWLADDEYVISPNIVSTTESSAVGVNYSYAVRAYAAPEGVYSTARMQNPAAVAGNIITWSFPVESGFSYLIRFHFCDFEGQTGEASERSFQIQINSTGTAEDRVETINLIGIPIGEAVYKDYIINSSMPNNTTLEVLQISIIPNLGGFVSYGQGILNGLEILKLADSGNNLAGQYPFGTATFRPQHDHKKLLLGFMVVMVYLPSLWFVCLLSCHVQSKCRSFWSRCRKRISKCKKQSSEHSLCFSLEAIKSATNHFSEDLLIGVGGFGKVYKGSLDNGVTTVAIKRANAGSGGGLMQFQTEILLLSKLRHHHLVSLLGYCMEDNEMILVYNFMERGTLRENLDRTTKAPSNPPMPWERRLEICIGAARGLHYLHTGIKPPVIHRDVKSSNILLDHNWEAKLSDFGLSKSGLPSTMMSKSDELISTAVRGTFGYVDPEYFRRMALTEKSDVYSFGVVLFEVLCARPAVIYVEKDGDDQMTSLAEWVLELLREGNLDQAIDPNLQGVINPICLETFIDTAKKCLAEKAKDRPSIGDVLSSLELAWQQQCMPDGISDADSKFSVDDQPSPSSGSSDWNFGIEFSEILCQLPR